jgi:putative RNA 2'-phosphotransferase
LDDAERVRLERLLSWALRHAPEEAGIVLDRRGWVSIDSLVAALQARGEPVSPEVVAEIVAKSDKKRFAVSEDGARIRASQGHSIDVDLDLAPVTPPATLYHGTVDRFLASILRAGLIPKERNHVHLSGTLQAAREVGRRRGAPRILAVASGRMASAGHVFYRSANGVWLVESVPPEYLEVLE